MTSGYLNIAIKAAHLAASVIQHASRDMSRIRIETKEGQYNYVTEIDKRSEQIIIDTLKKAYPTHNILSEESGSEDNKSEWTWIIDPIDGTTNFIHSYPQYCISIALQYQDKITHGVIFDPNRNDIYQAELGKGAYLNDKRLRVTKCNHLKDALLGTGFPIYDMSFVEKYLVIFKDFMLNTRGQRRAGSAALDLAYVAAGYLDGFWEFNLKKCDIAAGYILIKEAGGIITDEHDSNNFWQTGNVIAGNMKMAKQILNVIQKYSN